MHILYYVLYNFIILFYNPFSLGLVFCLLQKINTLNIHELFILKFLHYGKFFKEKHTNFSS